MTQAYTWRSAGGHFSLRVARRTLFTLVLMTALLVASAWLSLNMGSHPITVAEVITALLGNSDQGLSLIINEIRLPRVLLALLAGSALGMAGLIFQGLVNNPLASPDVIGVTGGASAAAVAFLTLAGTGLSIHWLPAAAMSGAGLVALLILMLSWQRGISPRRLVLMGIGLAAALGAVTTLLILLSRDTLAMQAYVWLTGSLYATQWRAIAGMWPWFILATLAAVILARRLDVLTLGDLTATSLGALLNPSRLGLLICGVVLAGSAVAFAGGLSFIGLVAPHIARRLVAQQHTGLLIASALCGALILLYADMLGRLAYAPRDIPAGVFVAAIGAPFFVFLLTRVRG